MAGIFGPQGQGPTKINQVRINQSVLGYPLPVLMGAGKIQQSLLWVDGFTQSLVNTSGGKGAGGGKDGNQYVYTADVIAALCAGGFITGAGDVWCGQSWLSNTSGIEAYTIVAGTPYTPTNAATMTVDKGVGYLASHAGSYNDLGASGATVLTGSSYVPMQRVAHGAALNAGQYSINPANNQYSFSPANAGITVQIQYSFALGTIKKQDKVLIPSGLSVQVGGTIPFAADGGVIYYSEDGTDPRNGQALQLVSGTPTAAGTYSVSGSAPATYQFAAADAELEVLITYQLNNSAALPSGTSTSLNFSLFTGSKPQSTWALLLSNFAGAALGYSGICFAAYSPMDLGYDAQIQENTFEIFTSDAWGGGIIDCNPVQCILRVLTDAVWGLGAGAVPFPTSAIDDGEAGTWGLPTPNGAPRADSTASSWFAANGFFISPVIDKQDTAASCMSKWLEAGQCAAFMSEGLLKLVPYGDTSTAGNGATWIAPSSFACALDDTCFLSKGSVDPVKISSSPWQDAFNTVQVQWSNREAQYSPEITPESDQAAINRYGSRIEDPQTWDFITTLPSATFAASMRVKRNVYTRNTYEFSLGYRYSFLEPMDVVYITTSSVWAAGRNNTLGIVNLPVRITKIVDNPNGTLDITCEDYPFGVHQPTIYNKQLAAGEVQPNQFADPGNSEVVLFEATSRLTGFQGNQIWIGALGTSANWGKCNVLASMDGDTYVPLGTITKAARLGVLGAAFPSGTDPDTTDSLVFDLAENAAGLESATEADADANNTLCFVDGELVSYSACAVTGVNQATATGYIRRGQLGSTISAHAAGSLFLRLDNAIFKYTYDPSWAGKTIYLKFQSVNVFGNSPQDLSTLTAVAFTIPGLNPGTVDAATGLVISQHLPPNVSANSASNAIFESTYDSGSGTAIIDINGPAGPGYSWEYQVGTVIKTVPSGVVAGVAPGVAGYVVYDTLNGMYLFVAGSAYQNTLNDFYILVGTVTTATSAGSTSSGGGFRNDHINGPSGS